MDIFYRKHYAATTPFWLHWLIIAGIALQGSLAMLRQLMKGSLVRSDTLGRYAQ
jgi:uncharacterized protein (DUF983 family)